MLTNKILVAVIFSSQFHRKEKHCRFYIVVSTTATIHKAGPSFKSRGQLRAGLYCAACTTLWPNLTKIIGYFLILFGSLSRIYHLEISANLAIGKLNLFRYIEDWVD